MRHTRVPTTPPAGFAATWVDRYVAGWIDGTACRVRDPLGRRRRLPRHGCARRPRPARPAGRDRLPRRARGPGPRRCEPRARADHGLVVGGRSASSAWSSGSTSPTRRPSASPNASATCGRACSARCISRRTCGATWRSTRGSPATGRSSGVASCAPPRHTPSRVGENPVPLAGEPIRATCHAGVCAGASIRRQTLCDPQGRPGGSATLGAWPTQTSRSISSSRRSGPSLPGSVITFDPDRLEARAAELEAEMGAPGFWDDQAARGRRSPRSTRG